MRYKDKQNRQRKWVMSIFPSTRKIMSLISYNILDQYALKSHLI